MMLHLSCLFDIHLSDFSNVVECVPHPTPRERKSVGAIPPYRWVACGYAATCTGYCPYSLKKPRGFWVLTLWAPGKFYDAEPCPCEDMAPGEAGWN